MVLNMKFRGNEGIRSIIQKAFLVLTLHIQDWTSKLREHLNKDIIHSFPITNS